MSEDREIHVIVAGPIEPGSIILITRDQLEEDDMAMVMIELKRCAGHDRFMVMEIPDGGTINLYGPDELTAALRQLAKEITDATQEGHHPPVGKGHGAGAPDLPAV